MLSCILYGYDPNSSNVGIIFLGLIKNYLLRNNCVLSTLLGAEMDAKQFMVWSFFLKKLIRLDREMRPTRVFKNIKT